MHSYKLSRRTFLERAGTLAAGAAAISAGLAGTARGAGKRMRLGAPSLSSPMIRRPCPRTSPPRVSRRLHAPCTVDDRDRIKAIIKEYAAQDVVIAETGAWRNMQDPDPTTEANLAYVQERLALADELGARCCVDTAGSHSRTNKDGPHPDNITPAFIEKTVENCRKLIDAVKPTRTKFTIEMMSFIFPTGLTTT